MRAVKLLSGTAPGGTTLYAGIDPEAIYSGCQVCEFRFSARLVPYRTEEAARDALAIAGCTRIGECVR